LPEELIYLLDLKPGGKRYKITTLSSKNNSIYLLVDGTKTMCRHLLVRYRKKGKQAKKYIAVKK